MNPPRLGLVPSLPSEADAREHSVLVAGELERLARWRRALLATAQMQQAAIDMQLDALQETQDFIRWIDEQVAPMSPGGA